MRGTPLRIAAVSGFGRYQLLPLFREGPLADIPIRMRFPTAADVVRQVETGACDLGFVHRMEVHDRLSHVPVGTEEIVCVASVASAQTRHSLDVAALREADYMTYDESNYVFATWFTQIVGMNMTRLNTVATSKNWRKCWTGWQRAAAYPSCRPPARQTATTWWLCAARR